MKSAYIQGVSKRSLQLENIREMNERANLRQLLVSLGSLTLFATLSTKII